MAAVGEENTASGQALFPRRIEFHTARIPYSGVPISSGDFHLEVLNSGNSEELREASGTGVGVSAVEAASQGKKSAGGELLEHGLDPELSFRISFQRIGAGLENLGNTCYLNSVLQCLTYTEPFAAYLQSGKHKSTCRAAGFCAMCALQNHVKDALQSSGKILRPFHLVRNLRCISRSFRNSRQEDAHEYMVNLLESMHKCCLPSGVPSESPSAYEKSLVHKIFGGQLRSQVKCMQCSHCSNKFDPFLDLSLEILRADSLRKAFAHFTATEQLDGGQRQYQCQHCQEKVQAFKQLTIHKAPYVLTIHLKRFGSSIHGEKINKKVEFEPTLDLKPFVSDLHEGELKYTLYGVLVHAGWSTHSGHYFCYVRTSAGLWYSLDDNHVSQVSEKTVLSREAYMLFYVRNRTSKRSVEVNLNADKSSNSSLNKEIPPAEMSLKTVICSSTKAISDDIIHLFKNQKPIVQHNGHTINKAYMLLESKKESADTSAQGDAAICKMETSGMPLGNVDKRPFSPSNVVNGAVKEDISAKLMKHKINGPDFPKRSINRQGEKGREGFLNLMETKLDESAKISTLLDEANLVKNKREKGEKGVMLKRTKMPLLAEGSYFGRRQLFLMSLRLRTKKKKKGKKHHQSSRNKANRRSVDPRADSQGASTSETFQTLDINSMNSSEKDSISSWAKKSKKQKVLNYCNNYHEMKDKEIHQSCTTGGRPGPLKPLSKEDDIHLNCVGSLLRASLRESTVARWDSEDLQTHQTHELEDHPKRNIGYLLDEWDEEYDRGKRKKLKSRHRFDGPNPFQMTADFKAQQRSLKLAQTSFGKEPFRI